MDYPQIRKQISEWITQEVEAQKDFLTHKPMDVRPSKESFASYIRGYVDGLRKLEAHIRDDLKII